MTIDYVLGNVKEPSFSKTYAVKIKKSASGKEVNIVKNSEARKVLENKNTDVLLDPYHYVKSDSLHFRNSGLNQVLCRIAKDNGVIVGFSFSNILKSKGRNKILERVKQNIKLCRKYKIPMLIASFAENKYELRSANELQNFALFLGMNTKEAKEAVNIDLFEIKEEKLKYIVPGLKKVG